MVLSKLGDEQYCFMYIIHNHHNQIETYFAFTFQVLYHRNFCIYLNFSANDPNLVIFNTLNRSLENESKAQHPNY